MRSELLSWPNASTVSRLRAGRDSWGAEGHSLCGAPAMNDLIPMRDPKGNTLERALKNRRTARFEMREGRLGAHPAISQKKRRLNRRRGYRVCV